MRYPGGNLWQRCRRLGILAGGSFAANIALTVFLTEVCSIPPKGAFALVLTLLFAANFLLTRRWVFGDRARNGNATAQLLRCLVVSLTFRVFEWLAFFVALEQLGLNYVGSLVAILCLSFATKSVIYDRLVFR